MMRHQNDGLLGLAVGWAVWINIDGCKVVWLCIFLHLHSRDVDPLPMEKVYEALPAHKGLSRLSWRCF